MVLRQHLNSYLPAVLFQIFFNTSPVRIFVADTGTTCSRTIWSGWIHGHWWEITKKFVMKESWSHVRLYYILLWNRILFNSSPGRNENVIWLHSEVDRRNRIALFDKAFHDLKARTLRKTRTLCRHSCRYRRPLTGGYRPFLGYSKKVIKDTTTNKFTFSHPKNWRSIMSKWKCFDYCF